MKKIKIAFTDFHSTSDPEIKEITRILQRHYDVLVTEDNPEYVFYSAFGYKHLAYDCIRIFITGECITPDFNECDYAAGFDHIEFGDRYLRYPNFLFPPYREEYLSLFHRKKVTREEWRMRKGFCSFVVSNPFADEKRKEMFEKLSAYRKVDSGGRYLNNTGKPVENKQEFLKARRFNISFENSSYRGYTTEKLIQAFEAYAIPVYYGDPLVTEDFNETAFINCRNDVDSTVKQVISIDEDEDAALAMLNENPVRKALDPDALEQFLVYIMDQKKEDARRRPASVNVKEHESMILRHRFFEEHIYHNLQRAGNQIRRLKQSTKSR